MSSPATLVGFVPEPNCGRGTVGILWSCATAIFLCSWTMLHGGLKSKKRKLRLLAFMLIFPEGIACQEIQTFINARRLQREVRKHSGWEKLTLRQAFLLELGGIHFSPGIDSRDLPHLIPPPTTTLSGAPGQTQRPRQLWRYRRRTLPARCYSGSPTACRSRCSKC